MMFKTFFLYIQRPFGIGLGNTSSQKNEKNDAKVSYISEENYDFNDS